MIKLIPFALKNLLRNRRRTILSVLDHANGKRSQAARSMKISRSRLYRRMEALGIHQKKDGRQGHSNG